MTAGVQALIEKAPLRVVPSPYQWVDIETQADVRWAEGFLLSRVPSEKDGLVAKRLNRRLSFPRDDRAINLVE